MRHSRPGLEATVRVARAGSIELATEAPEETERVGEAVGRAAFPGAVVLLEGPLGAGKTVLARGVARGLGATSPVSSPSFTLLAIHEARLPLFHLDLYRVGEPGELRAIDLDELLGSGGVVVVEWPRWLLADPPPGRLEVRIRHAGGLDREIRLQAEDPRWVALLEDLAG